MFLVSSISGTRIVRLPAFNRYARHTHTILLRRWKMDMDADESRWEEKYTYLRNLNPLPGDDDIRFSEEGHAYNIRGKDGKWIPVVSAGSFLDKYAPEFESFAVTATRKSANDRYNRW